MGPRRPRRRRPRPDADPALGHHARPGRGFAYVQEFTVHAWDLAVATGREGELDAALAEECEPIAHRMVPAESRGAPVTFGPVVEVDDDAGPYSRLVAWLGRDPRVVVR